MPHFEGNNANNSGGNFQSRGMPKFESENTALRGTRSPNTKTLHPGMGLKVLKNVLTTTPKRYLKKVIKRDASARKAKKLLPKKKKFLIKYVQAEIRPKKRKSSAKDMV